MMVRFALWLSLSFGAAPTEDPVALAKLLIGDGHWDRAAAILDDLEPADEDRAQVHGLKGLVALQRNQAKVSVRELRAAVSVDPESTDPVLHLYLARALLLDEQPEEALMALEGRTGLDGFPSAWLVRARATWTLGDLQRTWAALEEGGQRFPAEPNFPRQQVLLLIEHGLTREASERAAALMTRADIEVADILTLAEAMRSAGETQRATVLLEEALLRYPADVDLRLRSAAVALDAEQPLTAARHLQVAAEITPALSLEAAELFRQAGQHELAMYMNASVSDPVNKARQRFGLLLDGQRFEVAAAQAPRLSRLGILQDDAVRYGLAYAWFRIGETERAEALLDGISDPEIFAQVTALREAMQ